MRLSACRVLMRRLFMCFLLMCFLLICFLHPIQNLHECNLEAAASKPELLATVINDELRS